jgi:hypothetical protein
MKYDWKKTLFKMAIVSLEVVLAGLAVYFTENGLFLLLIPAIEGLRNYLKHRD